MKIECKDIENFEVNLQLNEVHFCSICVLPDNYSVTNNPEEFVYSSSLGTLQKLAKQKNLPLTVIGKDGDYDLVENRGVEWFAPVLYIYSGFYSQNPDAVLDILEMLSNYLIYLFKLRSSTNVNFKVLARDEGTKITREIKYKGPVEGLKEFNKIIDSTFKEIKKK